MLESNVPKSGALPRPTNYGTAKSESYNRPEFDAWMASPQPGSNPFQLLSTDDSVLPEAKPDYHYTSEAPIYRLADGRWLVKHPGVVNVFESAPKWLDGIQRTNERLDQELLEGREPAQSRALVDVLDAAANAAFMAACQHKPAADTQSVSELLEKVDTFDVLRCAYDIFLIRHKLNEDAMPNDPMAHSHCGELQKFRAIIPAIEERMDQVDPEAVRAWVASGEKEPFIVRC